MAIDNAALLRNHPLFKQLQFDQIQRLAHAAQVIRIPKHGILFRRGELAQGLYLLCVGSIKGAIPAANGHEKVIEFFQAGQCLGEAMMFLQQPYLTEAQALEDSLLLWLDRREILAVLESQPLLAQQMLTTLSLRVGTLMRDIESVNLLNASQRVVDYLLKQPYEHGRTQFSVNKSVIASKLGLTPETLSRTLHHLRDAKLISVLGREVQIHDRAALGLAAFGEYGWAA